MPIADDYRPVIPDSLIVDSRKELRQLWIHGAIRIAVITVAAVAFAVGGGMSSTDCLSIVLPSIVDCYLLTSVLVQQVVSCLRRRMSRPSLLR